MILVNTFEEAFGDIYPKGVWRELGKKASSNIARYVVALASFIGTVIYSNVPLTMPYLHFIHHLNLKVKSRYTGYKRSFACTGFFIEWNGSTIILTSASLVRSSSDENRIDENLRVGIPHCSLIDYLFKALLLKCHCIVCRLRYCFPANGAQKAGYNIIVCITILL